jgi:hypothetical protein
MLIDQQLLPFMCSKRFLPVTCLPRPKSLLAHGHGKHSLSLQDVHFSFHVYVTEDTPKYTMFIHSSQNLAVIRAPGMDTLKIPLAAEHTTIDDVSVWEWSGSAYDEGAEVSEWFSTYFGKPSRLVRFKEGSGIYISLGIGFAQLDDLLYCLWTTLALLHFFTASETRPTDPYYAQGYKIMFTDRFPFLIASQVTSYFYSVLRQMPCVNVAIHKTSTLVMHI